MSQRLSYSELKQLANQQQAERATEQMENKQRDEEAKAAALAEKQRAEAAIKKERAQRAAQPYAKKKSPPQSNKRLSYQELQAQARRNADGKAAPLSYRELQERAHPKPKPKEIPFGQRPPPSSKGLPVLPPERGPQPATEAELYVSLSQVKEALGTQAVQKLRSVAKRMNEPYPKMGSARAGGKGAAPRAAARGPPRAAERYPTMGGKGGRGDPRAQRAPPPTKRPRSPHRNPYFEEDDDLDGFIEDDIGEQAWAGSKASSLIQQMAYGRQGGYDPHRYRDDPDDGRGMEASFSEIVAEDARSTRIANQDDHREWELEQEELKKQQKRRK